MSRKRHDSNHAYELGDHGEREVAEILKAGGYHVETGGKGDCDLTINYICTVEIKTATETGRTDCKAKRWQFSLFGHRERQEPFREDLLILRCETSPPCHFIIPGCIVPHYLTKIDITTKDPHHYRGKWALYRERWDFVDIVLKWCHNA